MNEKDATRRPQSRFAAGYMTEAIAIHRMDEPLISHDEHEALTFHKLPTDAGVKFDQGKAPMSLLDRHAIEAIAQVLAFGAKKYSAHNWRKGIAYSRLLDAAMRHLFAFADGEDLDPESGLSHIAHAGCCIVFLLGMIEAKPEMDDRHTA